MAKLHGLLIDKKEVAVKDGSTVKHVAEFVPPNDRLGLSKAGAHILERGIKQGHEDEERQVEFVPPKAGAAKEQRSRKCSFCGRERRRLQPFGEFLSHELDAADLVIVPKAILSDWQMRQTRAVQLKLDTYE